jgi:hypothetical protein
MKISENILMKHLAEATIEQVANDYRKNGYEVVREARLDNIRADLVARKDGELIVFVFKSKKIWGKDRIEEIKKLRNYVVREHGTGFKLVLVNNPLEGISVKVDDLEQILRDLVIKNPDLYDEIATHKEVKNVSDVNLNEVTIRKDEVELLGSAVVNMILQYGSDEDIAKGRDLSINESFMLDFHILFDRDFEVREIYKFNLDTSDYYDSQDVGSLQVASKS